MPQSTLSKSERMELRRKLGLRELPEAMKKYIGPEYAMAFTCLSCRTSNMRHYDLAPSQYPLSSHCPICKGETFNLGRNFKPPKKSNDTQWRKIEFLIEHGFQFQKIRLVSTEMESVPYPETLKEAKEFVVKYKKWAIKSGI